MHDARAASAGHGGHERREILRLTTRAPRQDVARKVPEPPGEEIISGPARSFNLLRFCVFLWLVKKPSTTCAVDGFGELLGLA